MRIIFTGAQGTGKTTILNYFQGKQPIITNVCRTLAKNGVKINEMGDDESQATIFNVYYDLLAQKNYISDRGLTDVMAYSKWLYEHDRLSEKEWKREQRIFKTFIKTYPAIYLYFPIEFRIEDDGVRSTDEDFRKEIDTNILKSLQDNPEIPGLTVHGSVEERLEFINRMLQFSTRLINAFSINGKII